MLNKKIPIKDYANLHNKSVCTVRQKAQRGGFKTARKIGRDWFIDKTEPYIDYRFSKYRDNKSS